MADKNKQNAKKASQLGISSWGKALYRLKSQMLFKLLQELKRTECFRCGKEMTQDDYSLDHKKDWLDGDPTLFWDLENISFSHMRCNKPRVQTFTQCTGCEKPFTEVTQCIKWKNKCVECHKKWRREKYKAKKGM
jgi:hypothetical protein